MQSACETVSAVPPGGGGAPHKSALRCRRWCPFGQAGSAGPLGWSPRCWMVGSCQRTRPLASCSGSVGSPGWPGSEGRGKRTGLSFVGQRFRVISTTAPKERKQEVQRHRLPLARTCWQVETGTLALSHLQSNPTLELKCFCKLQLLMSLPPTTEETVITDKTDCSREGTKSFHHRPKGRQRMCVTAMWQP